MHSATHSGKGWLCLGPEMHEDLNVSGPSEGSDNGAALTASRSWSNWI